MDTHPLDHVALVVARLEPVQERLLRAVPDLRPGPVEEFPGEGTRELYLGEAGRAARLLLMQPLGDDGPYARALAKRGPGLHHVALHVPQLNAFCAELQGWLVHPACLADLPRRETLWLARPGVPTLLEVHRGESAAGPPVVEQVAVPVSEALRPLLQLRVGERRVAGLTPAPGAATQLRLGGRVIDVEELLGA